MKKIELNLKVLLTLIVIGLALLSNAQCKNNDPDLNILVQPFVEMLNLEDCSDILRSIWVINEKLVLVHRQGNCPDNSYRTALYDETVDRLLCQNADSIAGPVLTVQDESYREMFNLIMNNLDHPNLGLGSSYSVVQMQ